MKTLVLATAALIAGASVGWAQTAGDTCGDVISNPKATCPSVMDPGAGGSFNSGAAPGSSNGVIDNGTTGSIQNPSPDTGFGITEPNATPTVTVPIDPLGQNVGQNPYGGGNQIGIPRPSTNSAIGSRSGGIASQSIR
jgi:hypothetical protein